MMEYLSKHMFPPSTNPGPKKIRASPEQMLLARVRPFSRTTPSQASPGTKVTDGTLTLDAQANTFMHPSAMSVRMPISPSPEHQHLGSDTPLTKACSQGPSLGTTVSVKPTGVKKGPLLSVNADLQSARSENPETNARQDAHGSQNSRLPTRGTSKIDHIFMTS